MNLLLKKIIRIGIPALAVASFLIVSCRKENNALPEIRNVRMVDSTKRDSFFTQALPGTLVTIQGANLEGTKEIYFNDFPAPFNSNLVTSTNIIVAIPENTPTEATNPNVSSKIRVVTDHGEATFDFVIVAPPPAIAKTTNEMAQPGSSITIYGSNFYILDKVVFPGNIDVTSFSVNEAATEITVTVPAGLTESGRLQVVNKFGTGVSPFFFNDSTTGVLCNFDNVANFSWGCDVKSDPSAFPGARGSYAQMTFSGIPANEWSWWNGGRSLNTNSGQWVPGSDIDAAPDSYALKFEIYVKEPWGAGSFFIVKDYDWTYVALYTPWKAAGTEFKSDSWQTVTIPLSQFKTNNGTGDAASTLAKLVGSGAGSIDIMFVNDTDTPVDNFDAAVDNIRIIKVK